MENREDVPMSFAFQLSMNEKTMESFPAMTQEEKNEVVNAARNVTFKEQMKGIISDLEGLS